MVVRGTTHKDGGYTVTADGPKFLRRMVLDVFVRTNRNRSVRSRTDRYVIFGKKREE